MFPVYRRTQHRTLLADLAHSKKPLITAALFQAQKPVAADSDTLNNFITALARIGEGLQITRREEQHVADAFLDVRLSVHITRADI